MDLSISAWIILATQAFTLLGAIAAFIKSLNNGVAIRKLDIKVNGRLTELLELNKISARAEGRLEGMAQEKLDKLV